VLVLWRLGDAGLDEHEAKLALPAQNMYRQSEWLVPGVNENDWPYAMPVPTPARYWLVPIANGRPRLHKTPLPYWTAAAMAHLVGDANQLSTRLSSAAGAVLVVLIALALARRMFSTRAAFLGALMLATSLGLVKYGKSARPEMLLCLCCTAAMGAFYVGVEAKSRKRRVLWMCAFWVLMGLANLAKQFVPLFLVWPLAAYLAWRETAEDSDRRDPQSALVTFLLLSAGGLGVHMLMTFVPAVSWWKALGVSAGKGSYLNMAVCLGGPMLWYLVRARAWRQITPLLPTAIPGFIIICLMFLPWMWYMGRLFGGFAGSVFSYEVNLQATGLGQSRPAVPWFYVTYLLMLVIPWIGFLPGGFGVAFIKRFKGDRRALVYLLLWSVGLLLLFTTAVEKRKHYILPMLPAICLSMGVFAEDVCWRSRQMKSKDARLRGIAYGAAGALMVLGAAGLPLFAPKDWAWVHLVWVLPVPGVLLSAAGLFAWRGRLRPLVPLVAITMGLVCLAHYGLIERWDQRRGFIEFGHAAAEMIPASDDVFHWDKPQAKTVFHFGRHMPDIRWRFQREAPLDDPATIRARVIAWLREDPTRAPWIVVYGDPRIRLKEGEAGPINAEELLPTLGYEEVLTVEVNEDKFGRLELFRYAGTSGQRAGRREGS